MYRGRAVPFIAGRHSSKPLLRADWLQHLIVPPRCCSKRVSLFAGRRNRKYQVRYTNNDYNVLLINAKLNF